VVTACREHKTVPGSGSGAQAATPARDHARALSERTRDVRRSDRDAKHGVVAIKAASAREIRSGGDVSGCPRDHRRRSHLAPGFSSTRNGVYVVHERSHRVGVDRAQGGAWPDRSESPRSYSGPRYAVSSRAAPDRRRIEIHRRGLQPPTARRFEQHRRSASGLVVLGDPFGDGVTASAGYRFGRPVARVRLARRGRIMGLPHVIRPTRGSIAATGGPVIDTAGQVGRGRRRGRRHLSGKSRSSSRSSALRRSSVSFAITARSRRRLAGLKVLPVTAQQANELVAAETTGALVHRDRGQLSGRARR